MWPFALILTALMFLAGCANTTPPPRVDVMTFDRGAFGLFWGGFSQVVKTECEKKKATHVADCAAFAAQDEIFRKQISTPPAAPVAQPSSVDMEQVLKILGTLGKLAL